MKWILLSLLLLSFTSCSGDHSEVINIPTYKTFNSNPAIIVIHGYYGSFLKNPLNQKREFLNFWDLFFSRPKISLNSTFLGIQPPANNLDVEGMIGNIEIIPYLYKKNIYSDLIKPLNKNPNIQVIPFVYDWREDLAISIQKLSKLIDELKEKGAPISIIAHSMGGLLTTFYLGYGNQNPSNALMNWEGAKNIKKVIFLGTPFSGIMNIFRDLQNGASFAFSSSFPNQEDISSFPASYYLLPTGTAEIYNREGRVLNESFFRFEFWENYNAGLLKNSLISEEFISNRKSFLREQLNKTKIFLEKIQFGNNNQWPAPSNLSILNIIGTKMPTLNAAKWDGKNFIFNSKNDSIDFFQDGDGTVTTNSAIVPVPLRANTETIYTQYSHTNLFKDPNVKSKILDFILK